MVCRGRAAGDAPVMWRCTRYVALHPLCGAAPEQKGCNAYSSGALPLGTSESVVGVCRGDCVAQRGGLPRHRCVWIGGHDRPREGAADPRYCCVWIGVQGTSRWRCTRYVAMHPLCGAAPEQKGCNAYGSGALPLGTSESVVGVCRGDCVAQRGGLPRHTEGSASRRVQLSVYPSFCLKGLIHDDVVVSGASGREAVEELRRSGALDALFERLDAGEVEMTGSQGLLPALLKEAWERGLAAELSEHLGYEKGQTSTQARSNTRRARRRRPGRV